MEKLKKYIAGEKMSTTIRVSRETKKRLEELGHKGQSFDEIVQLCAIELSNRQHEYLINTPIETDKGIEYIEIRVPKHIKEIKSTNVLGINIQDSLSALCEEHNIKYNGE